METFNSALNTSSIVNILTLRYDPSINPNLPKKTWKDFESSNKIPNISFIETQIEQEIKEKIDSLKSKRICVALSGGVAVSQFDVAIGSASETYYAGGPQIGASLETQLSKIDPNLGLRMEFAYTNYLTADINGIDGVGGSGGGTGNNSELTGHDTAGRIGITYRF